MDGIRVVVNPDTKEVQTPEEARQSAASQPQRSSPSFQEPHGRYRATIKDGVTTVEKDGGPGRFVAGAPTADPFSGIRNAYGNVVSRMDASPQDKINLGGDSVTIASAEAAGFITKGRDGFEFTEEGRRYFGGPVSKQESADPAAPASNTNTEQVEEQGEQGEAKDPAFSFRPESQEIIATAGQRVSTPVLDALVDSLAVDPESATSEKIVAAVSQSLEASPEETRKAIATVVEDLTKTAHTATARVGLDAAAFSAFTEWIWSTAPEKAKDAVLALTEGRTQKLTTLASDFVKSGAAYAPEEVASAEFNIAGVTTRQDGKHIIVRIPGHGEYPLSELLADGRAKVRRK